MWLNTNRKSPSKRFFLSFVSLRYSNERPERILCFDPNRIYEWVKRAIAMQHRHMHLLEVFLIQGYVRRIYFRVEFNWLFWRFLSDLWGLYLNSAAYWNNWDKAWNNFVINSMKYFYKLLHSSKTKHFLDKHATRVERIEFQKAHVWE